jgi:hypothetical protein
MRWTVWASPESAQAVHHAATRIRTLGRRSTAEQPLADPAVAPAGPGCDEETGVLVLVAAAERGAAVSMAPDDALLLAQADTVSELACMRIVRITW